MRAALGVLVIAMGGVGGPPDLQRFFFLGLAALFAMVYALPNAARRIIEMDRDGRLDHIRLAGRRPAAILFRLLLESAGPWIVAGLTAFVLSPATRTLDGGGALMIAALVGGSLSLSLLPMALPRGWAGADARLVALGLIMVALVGATAVMSSLQTARRAEAVFVAGLTRAQFAGLLIAAEAAVIALGLRRALRVIARPVRSTPASMRRLWLRPDRWNPSLTRALALCTPPAVMIGIITTALLFVVRAVRPATKPSDSPDWISIVLLSFMPLIVGVFVISTGARADRTSGRFDLLRLTPAPAAAVLLSTAIGVCVPFMIATAVMHGVVWSLWAEAPGGLQTALVAALFVAPMAAVEGWHGAWPWTYSVPALFVILTAVSESALWPPDSFTLDRAAVLLWVPWLMAVRIFNRPHSAPLTGWAGAALTASLAVAAISSRTERGPADLSLLTSALFAMSAFTVDRVRVRRWDDYAPGLAAAIVTALVVRSYDYRVVDAFVLAVAAAAAWWTARRIHQAHGAAHMRSGTICVLLALVFFLRTPETFFVDYVVRLPASRTDAAFDAYVTDSHIALTGLLVALACAVELVYRALARRRKV